MTCSGWPFTTLANHLPTLVGRGGHSEGHHVRRYGGRGGGVEDEDNAQPSLLLFHLRLF